MKPIKENTVFGNYFVFPKYLMEMRICKLDEHVYLLLLNRTRLSQRKKDFKDNNGYVYVIYRETELSRELRVPVREITASLDRLQECELIYRVKNVIYVLVPDIEQKKGKIKKSEPDTHSMSWLYEQLK